MPGLRLGVNMIYSQDTAFADVITRMPSLQQDFATAPAEGFGSYIAIGTTLTTVDLHQIATVNFLAILAYGNGTVNIRRSSAGNAATYDIDGSTTEPGVIIFAKGANIDRVQIAADAGTVNFFVFLAGD